MQDGQVVEREAQRLLPGLLAELLQTVEPNVAPVSGGNDSGWDLETTVDGQKWVFEVKSSSGPGIVSKVAQQLRSLATSLPEPTMAILVVPYMTPAGLKAAKRESLNWIDFSGNGILRQGSMYVRVEGRPNGHKRRGRPASAFAPKASRLARVMLNDPERWWRQNTIAEEADLGDGYVSRVVRRLSDDGYLERSEKEFRPANPEGLLDGWADDYKFERQYKVLGHLSGSGVEAAVELHNRLKGAKIRHAFTGLPAAWQMSQFASFRLSSVYVVGDPMWVAEEVGLRSDQRGANVQLLAPDDQGVFCGLSSADQYPCVTPAQVYLDLLHLPERAQEAAERLREMQLPWTRREE